MNKYMIKKSYTFNSKSKNIFVSDKTIKVEDETKYEVIVKKSKTLICENKNTIIKFKNVLETIHEESNSIIDSSELSDYKEDINKINNDDNNG